MKKHFKIFYPLTLFVLMVTAASCHGDKDYGPVKKIDFYAGEKRMTLNEVIRQEIGQHRKPVLYFTAEWCGPCRRFKKSLPDAKMREALAGSTLVMIDIDTDASEDTLSFTYNVHAVPTFIRVDDKGNIIKRITSAAWEEDTPENIAPVMTRFLE